MSPYISASVREAYREVFPEDAPIHPGRPEVYFKDAPQAALHTWQDLRINLLEIVSIGLQSKQRAGIGMFCFFPKPLILQGIASYLTA